MKRQSLLTALSGVLVAAATLAAVPASAACGNCGTVVDVKTITKQGEGSGAGAVVGGILGGVLGHQVGSGRGNTAATVVGAGAGAYAGHQVEKNSKTATSYEVVLKMEEGNTRIFTFSNPTGYRVGDKVKIIDKKLVRQ